jgi:hypothetical protein
MKKTVIDFMISRSPPISRVSKIAENQSEQAIKPNIYPAFILAILFMVNIKIPLKDQK